MRDACRPQHLNRTLNQVSEKIRDQEFQSGGQSLLTGQPAVSRPPTVQEETAMSTLIPSLLATALAMATATPSVHAAGLPSQSAPAGVHNVVLVHGAFADGAGWRGVYDDLTARGYRVSIVQNPLTSLADDVAATRRVLDRQDGPAILVGHSWGGTVITEAGVHDKVAGLVYVSALAPDAGETTAQQYAGFAPTPEFVIDVGSDGYGFIRPETFKAGFAHDASDADAAFLRDSQVPINMSVFETPLTQAAWRSRPSWAVIATEDKAFDQAMLVHMAQRIDAQITRVSASHALFMTQPKVVADTIDRAARAVVQTAR
jgi:pimeloyl-ACP methyl ester carboxylesterase